MVTFTAYVEEMLETSLPVNVEDDEISRKKQDISIMEAAVHKRDTMRVKEDIALSSNKPDIYELLWNTVEIRGRISEPKMIKSGSKENFLFLHFTAAMTTSFSAVAGVFGAVLRGGRMSGLQQ